MPNGDDDPAHDEDGDHQPRERAADKGVGDFRVTDLAEFSLAVSLANALSDLGVADAVVFALRSALHLSL